MRALDGYGHRWEFVMMSNSSSKVPEGTRRSDISLSKGFQHVRTGKSKPTATQKRRALKLRKPAVEVEAAAEAVTAATKG